MEFLTIFLSSLLGLVSPAGLVLDRAALNLIRSQLTAERLEVRVDNAPSYQLLQGKLERVRIAGRGLKLKQQDVRIAALELETDPIDLDPRSLGHRQPKLKRPFQTAVRLVLAQQDINQALQSPKVVESLLKLDIAEVGDSDDDSKQSYNLVNPRVEFLANNRVRFQVELTQGNDLPLAIQVESGLGVASGRQIQLVKPVIYVGREAVTQQLVNQIATNLSQTLDLGNLDVYGLKTRILQLKVNSQKLEIVTFVRVEPSSSFLQNRRS